MLSLKGHSHDLVVSADVWVYFAIFCIGPPSIGHIFALHLFDLIGGHTEKAI